MRREVAPGGAAPVYRLAVRRAKDFGDAPDPPRGA